MMVIQLKCFLTAFQRSCLLLLCLQTNLLLINRIILPQHGQALIDQEEEEIQKYKMSSVIKKRHEHLPDHTGRLGSSESEDEADGEAD
jgi:hypothetical protein